MESYSYMPKFLPGLFPHFNSIEAIQASQIILYFNQEERD